MRLRIAFDGIVLLDLTLLQPEEAEPQTTVEVTGDQSRLELASDPDVVVGFRAE